MNGAYNLYGWLAIIFAIVSAFLSWIEAAANVDRKPNKKAIALCDRCGVCAAVHCLKGISTCNVCWNMEAEKERSRAIITDP